MRTRIPVLVLSFIALVITLGISPQTCKATPIAVVYGENINTFNLTVTSGPITTDTVLNLVLGNNWTVTLNIFEDAGVFNDALTISGTAIHNVGPHGEGPNPVGVAFNFAVNAGAFAPGVNQLQMIPIVSHGQHFDQVNAILTFTVVNNLFFLNDITGYTLTVDGVHTATDQPIPEPATLILLGTGIFGVAARARRRRRMKNSEDG